MLITGGTGFLGSKLVKRLLAEKQEIRLFVRNRELAAKQLGDDGVTADIVTGTITDLSDVNEAMRGVETVIHLAAIGSPSFDEARTAELMAVNIGGTANILVAAVRNNVKRVIVASSAAVYGNSAESPKIESMPLTPSSPYGVSKVAAERLCEIYGNRHGMTTIALRFFNVYGHGQDKKGHSAMVVPMFGRKLRNDDTLVLFGNGKQTRDFVHVDDCVAALLLAAEKPGLESGALNIGAGSSTPIAELIIEIGLAMKKTPNIEMTPSRPGDIEESVADISAARELLGYSPQIDITEGLRATFGFDAPVLRRSGDDK